MTVIREGMLLRHKEIPVPWIIIMSQRCTCVNPGYDMHERITLIILSYHSNIQNLDSKLIQTGATSNLKLSTIIFESVLLIKISCFRMS